MSKFFQRTPAVRTLFRPFSVETEQFITRIVKASGHLSLSNRAIEEMDVEQLATEMRLSNSSVKAMDITSNHFSSQAAVAFADLLEKNKKLEEVMFRGNNFGEGITAIAKALKRNESLKKLVWSRNWVDSSFKKASKDFVDLATSPSLKGVAMDIDFSSEEIDAIIEGLKNNKSLQTLYLYTPLTDSITDAVIKMIPKNTSLQELTYGGVKRLWEGDSPVIINSAFCKKIGEALKENAFLKSVTISNAETINTVENDNPAKIRDAVKDYSAIMQARIIRKISKTIPNYKFDDDELKDIASYSAKKTEEILLKNLTNAEKIAFSDHWHSPFHQTTSQKLRDYGNVEWAPLFGQKEIAIPPNVVGENGWKLVTRTNPRELAKEGKDLEHCVGGYTSSCLTGDSHIVSVVDAKTRPISTIEFSTTANSPWIVQHFNNFSREENSLLVLQHFGHKNQQPSRQGRQALKWLEQEVNEGSIKIDHAGINAAKDKNSSVTISKTVKALGFHPDEVGKVISVYKRQMLPSGKFEIAELNKNFLDDFLGEIEVEINGQKILLESTLAKDLTEKEARLNKIKAGIQGSSNKICGKDVVTSSVTDDKVFFSTKNPQALEKLQKLFEGKCQPKADGLLIEMLDPQEVRQVLTRTAQEQRNQQRQNRKEEDLEKPNSAISNQTIDKIERSNDGRQ